MAQTASSLDALYSEASRRAGVGRRSNPRDSAALISFYAGFPDPASLPKHDIIESTRMAIEQDGEWALQYGASVGDPLLIEELLRKLARDQKIEAGPENILITNGGSQALALMVDMLINPGDVIISEAPTWMGAVMNFRAAGAEVREVGIDENGFDVDQFERVLNDLRAEGRRAKLLYVIPTFQNPTGVTTSLARRQRLLELAAEHSLPVVEDDAYFDLRYGGAALPTLYMLDGGQRVMYMGTFSKIVGAGMRIGWVVAAPELINRLAALKMEGATSPFSSQVAAQFSSSGTLVEHVQELRSIYQARRDAMLQALEQSMPAGTSWTHPDGGFFIWVRFPKGVDAEQLSAAAREHGVELSPGPIFYFSGRGGAELRLSYSFADEAQIRQGIAIVGQLVAAQLGE